MPELSIVMPALNEEDNVRAAVDNTLGAFDKFKIDGELVVINDGSTDKTESIVREIMESDPRVHILIHDTPKGIGASFWDGVESATGDAVCMIPSDNEIDPLEVFRYYNLLEHVDMVIPFVFNKEVRTPSRNRISALYLFIINTTFRVYFNYTNGTIIYRRNMLCELDYHCTGFFFQTDILVRLVRRGYLFAEVPYRLDVRPFGDSKALTWPSLLQVMKGYLKLFNEAYISRCIKAPECFAEGSRTAERHKRGGSDEVAS